MVSIVRVGIVRVRSLKQRKQCHEAGPERHEWEVQYHYSYSHFWANTKGLAGWLIGLAWFLSGRHANLRPKVAEFPDSGGKTTPVPANTIRCRHGFARPGIVGMSKTTIEERGKKVTGGVVDKSGEAMYAVETLSTTPHSVHRWPRIRVLARPHYCVKQDKTDRTSEVGKDTLKLVNSRTQQFTPSRAFSRLAAECPGSELYCVYAVT
jgi:hypothetical protein